MVKANTSERRWRSAMAQRILTKTEGTTTIVDAVERLTEGLLTGLKCPPTDLEAIAPRVRVVAFEEADLPGAGELHRQNGGFKILYSTGLSKPRRRFTIAHELAHAFMDIEGLAPAEKTGKEAERLCDMFATEMLMPRGIFLRHLEEGIGLQKIFDLSKVFQTSLSATAMRCAELGKVSTFGVDRNRVTWARGIVGPGALDGLDSSLRETIAKATAGDNGEELLYIVDREQIKEWRVGYASLGDQKALLILVPLRIVTLRL